MIPTRHCDECDHFGDWFKPCKMNHAPKFYMPKGPYDKTYGWKRKCFTYANSNSSVPSKDIKDTSSNSGHTKAISITGSTDSIVLRDPRDITSGIMTSKEAVYLISNDCPSNIAKHIGVAISKGWLKIKIAE